MIIIPYVAVKQYQIYIDLQQNVTLTFFIQKSQPYKF